MGLDKKQREIKKEKKLIEKRVKRHQEMNKIRKSISKGEYEELDNDLKEC